MNSNLLVVQAQEENVDVVYDYNKIMMEMMLAVMYLKDQREAIIADVILKDQTIVEELNVVANEKIESKLIS